MDIFTERHSQAPLLLLLMLVIKSTSGQGFGETCLESFKQGKDDFIIDTDESVANGAAFLSAPALSRQRDCVTACCKDPRCNLAFMERGPTEGSIKDCFLFDCLYKQKYVCRFVGKSGYTNYVLNNVYNHYLNLNAAPKGPDTPPVADAGPDQVVQPQDTVTLTGMKSKDDNKIVSFKWEPVGEIPSAVIEQSPQFPDQITVSNLSSGKYKFQLTVTDTIGQSDSTIVTIMVLTPEQSDHHCMVPKKVGPCRGSFPRFHYNAASEQCEQFIFGGCRENRNNYLTMAECKDACDGASKKAGSGRGLIPQGEHCGRPCAEDQFTCSNGCCLDRSLECDSIAQCSDNSDERNCSYLGNKFRVLLDIKVDERIVRCTEFPDTGSCRESNTRWYYEPTKSGCARFNYGGCEGNSNNFKTQELCETFCRGVTEKDVYVRQRQLGNEGSGSRKEILIIAGVMGAAIFILLIVLGYCFFKGRKSSQHDSRGQFTALRY